MATNWEQKLAKELEAWLAPVVETQGQPERVEEFLDATGWHLDALAGANQQSMVTAFAELAAIGQSLFDALSQPPDSLEGFLLEIGPEAAAAVDSVSRLASALPASLPADVSELPADVLNYLTVNWLRRRHALSYFVLKFLGVARSGAPNEEVFNGAVYRTKNTNPLLSTESLIKLFDHPEQVLKSSFWSAGLSDTEGALALAIELLSLAADLGLIDTENGVTGSDTLFDAEADTPAPSSDSVAFSRRVMLADGTIAEAGVRIARVATGGPGALLTPFGELTFDFPIGPVRAKFGGTLQANPIRVDQAGIRQVDVSQPPAAFDLRISYGDAATPAFSVGGKDGLRISVETVAILGAMELLPVKPRALIGFALEHFNFGLSASGGDGFLKTLLPPEGINGQTSLVIEWSTDGGVAIRGGGGLNITLPIHIQLGAVDIQNLAFDVKLKSREIPIDLGATFAAKLGPLSGVVEQVGVSINISAPEAGGNLGPFDAKLGFKPPKGVGLAINTGTVKGGGYLYFNFDKEEYAGVLELTINKVISLKAIGLITTRMPDGSKGFSLLIIITAEFGSPVQLGFGFTLSGVGGLLGLNRTMLLQPLAEGVRTGAINSVMFPTNVVANAPRIISDLQSFFPVHEGIFLIGPMAKLGWGTPNLVTLSLGIIIEIPGNIAILGVLKVVLPDEKKALLVLQANFIGAIEFDKKRAWFFASIFESRILFITIEGEIGVLVAWGDDPNFVISVGGFHPTFKAPPLPFPEPRRVTLSILNTSYARIRVEAYLAVTSNTVQFGANVEFFFGFDAIKAEGQFVFDALFRSPPLSFIITVSTSLSVQVFGTGLFSIRFRGSLEGTTPWRIAGTGTISLLFFNIPVNIDRTWGEEIDTFLPPILVGPLLVAELEKLENWKTRLPASNNLSVSLRKIDMDKVLLLHPIGTLQITQRAIPLDLQLDKVGNQKPEGTNNFTVSVSSTGLSKKGDLDESFAMGQFKDMDDANKLSSPAFEKWKAGIELSAGSVQTKTSLAVKRVVRYEKIIIDTNYKRAIEPLFVLFANLFTLFLGGNAVTKSTLSQQYLIQKQPFADKVAIQPDLWVVASNADNTALAGTAGTFTSQAKAHEYMQQQVKERPDLAENVHVIPKTELRRAAA